MECVVSIHILDHPIAKDALAKLRDQQTNPKEFRSETRRLSALLAYVATSGLPTWETYVATPLSMARSWRIHMYRYALVPIMRAGDGMLETFLMFLPGAFIWHMYISRNEETFEPCFHGSKVPERISDNFGTCFVLDPMLATGGSAGYAISHLKERGAKKIIFVGVIGAPEGAAKLERDHPDVPIILAAMDERLNDKAYIMPGLGDFGDRQYPVTAYPGS